MLIGLVRKDDRGLTLGIKRQFRSKAGEVRSIAGNVPIGSANGSRRCPTTARIERAVHQPGLVVRTGAEALHIVTGDGDLTVRGYSDRGTKASVSRSAIYRRNNRLRLPRATRVGRHHQSAIDGAECSGHVEFRSVGDVCGAGWGNGHGEKTWSVARP